MAKVELKKLVDHLGPVCRQALEEAASLTVAAGHREVMIEHLLLALAERQGGDLRMLLRAASLDPEIFCEDVRRSFSRLREGDGQAPVFSPLLIELLEDAWMVSSIDLHQPFIRSGAILIALLSDMGRFCRFEYARALESFSVEKCRHEFDLITSGSIENVVPTDKGQGTTSALQQTGDASLGALEKYAHNFTKMAREGKIDPVFCRDDEIRQIIDILARRRKNNPICVGEAGVGKTAVVEGLALKIVHDDVPESLKNFEIYGLDLGSLQAGASVKGEFEKRLKAVLDEVRDSTRPCVLFIDEAHTLIGAGGQAGGSDAANLLKPALARGEIKTIAATTWSEYKKYFEKDPALTRRFQLVKLEEPTPDQAQIILRGLVPAYEKAHGDIYISEAGVEAAVRLSARYITGRQLPDKAIDVLDTACARVKAAATGVPLTIEKLTKQIQALEREREVLLRDMASGLDDKKLRERVVRVEEHLTSSQVEVEQLSKEHQAQCQIVQQLKELREQVTGLDEVDEQNRDKLLALRAEFDKNRKQNPLTSLEVGVMEIASVIADWTGVPTQSMQQDDVENLLYLARSLGQGIKGQDHALQLIEQQLQASRLDLARGSRPLGVFLLVGPSGVGKTQTALSVARHLFGGEQFLTTINMSEFQEKHSMARLIGSPPGYVGYGEGGVLTEAIRKKPYSVVLLDEVEKAELDVLNLFYQAFDKGMLADGEGREIDCKNIVFFLCSNLGADHIHHLAGFVEDGQQPMDVQDIAAQIHPLLAHHFKPALLARMQPIIYLPLTSQILCEIIESKLSLLQTNLVQIQGIDFTVSEKAKERLQNLCHEGASGARLIDQVIAQYILPAIARLILTARLEERDVHHIAMDVDGGQDFCFSENVGAHHHDEPKPKALRRNRSRPKQTPVTLEDEAAQ